LQPSSANTQTQERGGEDRGGTTAFERPIEFLHSISGAVQGQAVLTGEQAST